MKPKTDLSLKEFKDQSLNGAKRCDEAKLPVIIARDDKLKKIHKTSRKGKPTTMQRIATKEKEDKEEKEELPDTFDKVFEKVYKEKCTLNSLLLNIHDMEELADPDAIALYLIKNMAWAVHHYRSGLNINCIRLFNITFQSEGTTFVRKLIDYTQSRQNMLELFKNIHDSFVQIMAKNQLAYNVVAHIAENNTTVREYLKHNDNLNPQMLDYQFFKELMNKNQMLKGVCKFAEQMLDQKLLGVQKEQCDQLKLILECSGSRAKPKKCRKKKKQEKIEMTEEQREEAEWAGVTAELTQMQLPTERLMVEFDEHFLMRYLSLTQIRI